MTTMREDTRAEVIRNLQQQYKFKKGHNGKMHGLCPVCQNEKKEAWTNSDNPWVIICPRENKCGARTSTRELFPSAFTQYSKQHPATPRNPNATADAYLQNGRMLALAKWQGAYTQQTAPSWYNQQTTPTIRFNIYEGGKPALYWERVIEPVKKKPKALFEPKKEYKGLAWYPSTLDPYTGKSVLGYVKEIWLVEGIFDAMALNENGIHAIATLTSGNFPAKTLKEISDRMHALGAKKPKLVLAFDNDNAGRNAIHKLLPTARQHGYDVSAAQTTEWASGKKDWNDLHIQTLNDYYSNKTDKYNAFSKEKIDLYCYYGDLLIAETPKDKALLIHNKWNRTSFPMFFAYRTYWVRVDVEGYNMEMNQDGVENMPYEPQAHEYKTADGKLDDPAYKSAYKEYKQAYALWRDDIIQSYIDTNEIMNCQPHALYYQQNLVTDESWYFFRIRKPSQRKYDPIAKPIEHKNTFTGGQLSTGSEFKKRLLSVAPGVIYTGDSNQLNKMLANMIGGIKTVETIDFIGYSSDHKTYIFNKVAVKDGKTYDLNKDDYYEIGNTNIKTLANQPMFYIADKDKSQKSNWLQDIITGWNMQGVVALSGFIGSLFAQQIRSQQKSFPFLEIIGEPATGKSTLISFFWRLLGRTNNQEGIDPNKATRAGRLRALSQVSNLPCVFIESDRDNLGSGRNTQFNWDELKNLYDGGTIGTRGMKTSGNEVYEPPFRGTIIISQNLPVVASKAILSRICHMCFTKDNQTQHSENAARRIESLQSEDISYFLIDLLKKEKQYLQIFNETKTVAEKWLKDNGIKDFRVAHCHAQLLAMFFAMARTVLPQLNDMSDMVKSEVFSMATERDQTLDTEHPLNIQFFDTLLELNSLSADDRGGNAYEREKTRYHLNHSNKTDRLAISMPEVYRTARQHGYELPPQEDMQAALRQSRQFKFIAANKVVLSKKTGKSIRCWVFEPTGNQSIN